MQILFLLALTGLAFAQYAINPYYSSTYNNNYGSTAVIPYYYGTGYGYPYSGTSPYTYGYYPTYGYTGTLLGGGYGYPYGYPYTGTGTIGTPGVGTGIGTGIVGDPTGGTGGVGPITGVAPGVGTSVVNPGLVGAGTTALGTGITALSATITGVNIPGTFTTGDTLVVIGVAPSCCPPGVRAGQGVWSINLLASNLAPYVHLAVKVGWNVMTINSAVNGWLGGWWPANPPGRTCPFQPNTPYSMTITNELSGVSFLINNQPYTYPHVRGGANVYAALGYVGVDKGQICSVTLIRGGVSSVLAIGASPLCGTIVG